MWKSLWSLVACVLVSSPGTTVDRPLAKQDPCACSATFVNDFGQSCSDWVAVSIDWQRSTSGICLGTAPPCPTLNACDVLAKVTISPKPGRSARQLGDACHDGEFSIQSLVVDSCGGTNLVGFRAYSGTGCTGNECNGVAGVLCTSCQAAGPL